MFVRAMLLLFPYKAEKAADILFISTKTFLILIGGVIPDNCPMRY
jgi:hypothetical protein